MLYGNARRIKVKQKKSVSPCLDIVNRKNIMHTHKKHIYTDKINFKWVLFFCFAIHRKVTPREIAEATSKSATLRNFLQWSPMRLKGFLLFPNALRDSEEKKALFKINPLCVISHLYTMYTAQVHTVLHLRILLYKYSEQSFKHLGLKYNPSNSPADMQSRLAIVSILI